MEYLQSFNLFLQQYEFNPVGAVIGVIAVIGLGVTTALVVKNKNKNKILLSGTENMNNINMDAIVHKSDEYDIKVSAESKEDQETFAAAFGDMINEVNEDVNNKKKIQLKEGSQEVWVNWMLNINGKLKFKQSEVVVSTPWGTKTAKDELEAQINKEGKEIAQNVEFSWVAVKIQPLH